GHHLRPSAWQHTARTPRPGRDVPGVGRVQHRYRARDREHVLWWLRTFSRGAHRAGKGTASVHEHATPGACDRGVHAEGGLVFRRSWRWRSTWSRVRTHRRVSKGCSRKAGADAARLSRPPSSRWEATSRPTTSHLATATSSRSSTCPTT